jgi:gelsolin
LVGGRRTLEAAPPTADEPRAAEKKLLRVSDRAEGRLTVTPVEPAHEASLTSDDIYVLDAGYHVWVWVGKNADANERKNGVAVATDYLNHHGLPTTVPITRILEGGLNEPFYAALRSSD